MSGRPGSSRCGSSGDFRSRRPPRRSASRRRRSNGSGGRPGPGFAAKSIPLPREPELNPEEWRSAKEILSQALERPKAERASFLDTACGGDAGLRRRIESLIEADAQTWNLVEAPAAAH